MNKLLLSIFCMLSFCAQAQRITTFKQAPQKAIFIAQLDSLYPPALGDSLAIFSVDEEQFIKAYTVFVQGFGQLLNDSNFVWPVEKVGEIRGFNRIYFNTDGSVAYWIYSLKKLELSDVQQKEFERLMLCYCQINKLQYPSKQNFVQCAPVLYRN
jgi:hypothetical protein